MKKLQKQLVDKDRELERLRKQDEAHATEEKRLKEYLDRESKLREKQLQDLMLQFTNQQEDMLKRMSTMSPQIEQQLKLTPGSAVKPKSKLTP